MAGKKGYKVEEIIKNQLSSLEEVHGITYEQGSSRIVDVNIDFAIPSLEDPWIIIMSSFQETTGSGQSLKTRDMERAFRRIQELNSRHNENRAFVHFVDGGGWLARKNDFRRLVEQCDYAINLKHLSMIESIIMRHLPEEFRTTTKRR